MPRSLTANAVTQKNTLAGAAPRIVVRIDWGGSIGTKYYADIELSTPVAAEARLKNASAIDQRLSGRGVQKVSDITVELYDDSDRTLLGYCDDVVLELKRCWVYQHFVGNDQSDMVPLLVGYVDSPVVWSEADVPTLRFDVTDIVTGIDETVGHIATLDDFPYIPPENEGAMLPLVFGRVEDLKALMVQGGWEGSLMLALQAEDDTLLVDGGERFPQDQEIEIRVGGEHITGTMHGRTFTISERNVAIFDGVTSANTSDSQMSVYDKDGPERDNVFAGYFIHLSGRDPVECRRYWSETGKILLTESLGEVIGAGVGYTVRGLASVPELVDAGTNVQLVSEAACYYVINDVPSGKVVSVKGYKIFELVDPGGNTRQIEELVEVPDNYYSVDLYDTTTFPGLGRPITTVSLPQPLTQMPGEIWASNDLWVEMDGYKHSGSVVRNPARVIQRLLVDFGPLEEADLDSDSFDDAADELADRRFGFALAEQRRLVELCADLSYQAQCDLMALAGVLYLFYKDDNPGTSEATFDDDDGEGVTGVVLDSPALTWQAVEDLCSEVHVSYKPDLSGGMNRGRSFQLDDETAEDAFGKRTLELDFWAYRIRRHAQITAQYYLNHYDRAWQSAHLATHLSSLQLLPADWSTVGGLPFWSAGQKARVDAEVQSDDGAPEADRIDYDLFLPIYPGCGTICEVPCQVGGCEGKTEHACADSCELADCESACETGCQSVCQLSCVSACEQGCEDQACEAGCEVAGCEGACQAANENACDASHCESGCESGCESEGCQLDCESNGCQSSCELDCETEGCESQGCESTCQIACEAQGCQLACEGIGCQSAAESHGCESWCEVDCESGGEVACGGSCETEGCEAAGCEISGCETGCQGWCESDCESGAEASASGCSFCGGNIKAITIQIANSPACVQADGVWTLPYLYTMFGTDCIYRVESGGVGVELILLSSGARLVTVADLSDGSWAGSWLSKNFNASAPSTQWSAGYVSGMGSCGATGTAYNGDVAHGDCLANTDYQDATVTVTQWLN